MCFFAAQKLKFFPLIIIPQVEDNRKFRVHLPGIPMVISEYQATRSLFQKATLPKGRYVIIPSTFQPGVIGNFLLRMYTSSNAHTRFVYIDQGLVS